ncbi:3-hydroxybutyrate dehydrogenase [Methylocaldum sp.]|uniref:3-hydroxybutyrate dehydrogenase n=1 Tax=Methylocaldum sp. TaxID=1969727 RepID=UPI002D412253|nr:3-hydroxybutyrate dehydrogenase [Methylocaldum sp.]HYE35197.1 3-hydroxybutyrate dehydrogenase [Methylocaldum sp.]
MLYGRIALVTGSTRGIGLGIATELARQGCPIGLNGFGELEEIERLVQHLSRAHGVKTVYYPADLSQPAAIRGMIQAVEADFGALDILVNNAGIQYVAPLEEFPDAQWEAVLALNLSAAFHTIKAALPGMKRRGWGRIVNIASVHGLVGSEGKAAYVAAKHGLLGLTKVVALETVNAGITCNAICPGWVLTPLVEKQIEDLARQKGTSREEATLALLREKQPMLEFSTPEDIGAWTAFLCSDAAKTTTGAAFPVDGGWIAR